MMHPSTFACFVFILASTVQSLTLRFPSWKFPSPPTFSLSSPTAYHDIHTLYNPPSPPLRIEDSVSDSQVALESYHAQQPLILQAQPLRGSDYIAAQTADLGAGTILMHSTAGHLVPLSFTLSPQVCHLGAESLKMLKELLDWLLETHPGPEFVIDTIEETVRALFPARFGEAEYQASLRMDLWNEDGRGGEVRIESGPLMGLVKLVQRAVEALWLETGEEGFGTLRVRGVFEEVGFEVWITWYEAVNDMAVRCRGGNGKGKKIN